MSEFIVVGSGIAGLRAAIELAKAGKVEILCKGDPWESNTRWAQGGIAAAMQEGDTIEFHLEDTLQAGDDLCYEPAVRVLVKEGPRRVEELVAGGAQFDQREGKFLFGREGAHSRHRILHSGDATGKEIVRALMNWVSGLNQIEIIPNAPAVDLIMDGNRCCGVYTLDESTGERRAHAARSVLLATGGAGQLYSQTTNPSVATGDGVAMAYRAGAELMDLEFFQFHPTAFHRLGAPRFLITEALRGEGAILRNVDGKAFMENYHQMADLAPRDVVSRAIIHETRKTDSAWVLLDATRIARRKLLERFPNIYQFLQTFELDLSRDLIPVSPSAHYWMGGVKTGLDGETSIAGLYAAGEVACAGVHGANRLASNSLLEGLVFGARAGEAMAAETTESRRHRDEDFFPPYLSASVVRESNLLTQKLQNLNWNSLGLVREEKGIQEALKFLNTLAEITVSTVEDLELRNLIDCSKLLGVFALNRRESRGSHFREDYPSKNLDWNGCHSLFTHGKWETRCL